VISLPVPALKEILVRCKKWNEVENLVSLTAVRWRHYVPSKGREPKSLRDVPEDPIKQNNSSSNTTKNNNNKAVEQQQQQQQQQHQKQQQQHQKRGCGATTAEAAQKKNKPVEEQQQQQQQSCGSLKSRME